VLKTGTVGVRRWELVRTCETQQLKHPLLRWGSFFRRAGIEIPYRMATPEAAAAEAWKFTTRNGGASIRVRGE